MLTYEYTQLINKVQKTGEYVDRLARIESNMNDDLESNKIDIKVKELLSNCIDDINKIYINSAMIKDGTQQEELS